MFLQLYAVSQWVRFYGDIPETHQRKTEGKRLVLARVDGVLIYQGAESGFRPTRGDRTKRTMWFEKTEMKADFKAEKKREALQSKTDRIITKASWKHTTGNDSHTLKRNTGLDQHSWEKVLKQ